MAPADLLDLSATELSRRIAARSVSCHELMQASLARIEALNPRFNAIVSLREPEALLAEAGERDAELARGERRGWMHGFPLAVKDLSHAAGLPTSMGSPLSPRSPASASSCAGSRSDTMALNRGLSASMRASEARISSRQETLRAAMRRESSVALRSSRSAEGMANAG